MTRYILVALLLSFPTRSVGQLISKAYCGKDGKAHINYKNGASVVASPEPKQVGCGNVVVANDGRTVGVDGVGGQLLHLVSDSAIRHSNEERQI